MNYSIIYDRTLGIDSISVYRGYLGVLTAVADQIATDSALVFTASTAKREGELYSNRVSYNT